MQNKLEFGIVFRIDDLDSKHFYIGETTVKKKWLNGYLGSGSAKWQRHLKKHPDTSRYPNNPDAHHYKRTILHESLDRDTLYDLELQEILKYAEYDGEHYIISNPLCMNHKTTKQNQVVASSECPECKGKNGLHTDDCSKSKGKCSDCGYSLKSNRHDPSCPHYVVPKDPAECPHCGRTTGPHEKSCPLYTEPKESNKCPKCGGKHGKHKDGCPDLELCKHCGYAIQSNIHAPDCPLYKEIPPCLECKGEKGNHKSTCSQYTPMPRCPECKAPTNVHKKTCSHFRVIVCPKCKGKGGHHKKDCPDNKRTPCPFCGSLTVHKADCPKKLNKSI